MPPTPGLLDQGGRDKQKATKAAAPISSGAFSFSFSPGPSGVKNAKRAPDERIRSGVPRRLKPSSLQGATSSSTTGVTPTKTKKEVKPLQALPSPISFGRDVPPSPALAAPGTARKDTPHKRLTSVLDEDSPFNTSPTRAKLEQGREEKRVRLGDIPTAPGTVDFVKLEARKEEEGIGVSPRKSKAIKWSGRGPPPPSSQLGSILRSANSSMSLFYNSLQRTLRPTVSKKSQGVESIKAPRPLDHLRSASLVLRPVSLFGGRTHQGIMMWCTLRPSGPGPAVNSLEIEGRRVLLVLQSLSSDCPRLGVDPKVVGNNLGDESRKWECGVWQPFIETRVPFSDLGAGEDEGRGDDELASEDENGGGHNKRGKGSDTTVIFASRYLFAQIE